jgi:hypothetical protein
MKLATLEILPSGLVTLSIVEHVHAEQVAELESPIHAQRTARRELHGTHRHVFVPRLQGGESPQLEYLRWRPILITVVQPVVVDFVIVIGHQKRRGSVCSL